MIEEQDENKHENETTIQKNNIDQKSDDNNHSFNLTSSTKSINDVNIINSINYKIDNILEFLEILEEKIDNNKKEIQQFEYYKQKAEQNDNLLHKILDKINYIITNPEIFKG